MIECPTCKIDCIESNEPGCDFYCETCNNFFYHNFPDFWLMRIGKYTVSVYFTDEKIYIYEGSSFVAEINAVITYEQASIEFIEKLLKYENFK